MLGVDEGGNSTTSLACPGPLRCRNGMEGKRCLAAGLRSEHFDDAAARKSLASQGNVYRQAPTGDALDLRLRIGPQRHDRAFAKFLLDLHQRVF